MAKKETKQLIFKLEEVNVDPTQYKPFSHKLIGENVYVLVDIPEGEVVADGSNKTIITLGGLSSVLTQVAEAVEEAATDYKKNFRS